MFFFYFSFIFCVLLLAVIDHTHIITTHSTHERIPAHLVAWIQDVHGSEWGCDHCPIYVSFITSYRTQHITKVSTYYLSLLPPLGGGLYVLHMGGGLVLMRQQSQRFVFAPKACFGSKGASERDYQDLRRRRCKPKFRESSTLEYSAVSQLVKSLLVSFMVAIASH